MIDKIIKSFAKRSRNTKSEASNDSPLSGLFILPIPHMLSCLNSSQTFVLTTRHHWRGKPAWGIKSTRATKKKDVQGSEWLTVWIRLARPTTRSFGNEETGSRSGIMPVDTAAESQELAQWYNSTWLAIGFERTGNRMASVFWMWQMLSIAISHMFGFSSRQSGSC